MNKLKAPENCDGCSHDGVSYDVDKDGNVEVPDEAVADLLHHGFKPVPVVEAKKAK
jgi:hypothetical protein